jgi:hypothetical protein
MGTPFLYHRRRVNRGFGHAPRFVMASSALYARLIAWRLSGTAW